MDESYQSAIGTLYGSLDQPELLQEFVSELHRVLQPRNVGFAWVNHAKESIAYVGSDMSIDIIEGYLAAIEHEPWTIEALRRGLIQQPTTLIGDELIDQRDLQKSRFYNEIYKPADVGDMICVGWNTDTFTAYLVVNKTGSNDRFGEVDKEILRPIERHISQYATLLFNRESEFAIDELHSPYIEIDRRGIRYVSPKANSLLKDHPYLTLSKSGLLTTNQSRQSLLEYQIGAVLNNQFHLIMNGGLINIAPGCQLALVPGSKMRSDFFRDYFVRILITDWLSQPIAELVDLHKLTDAESRIVRGLLDGHSLMDMADRSSRSIHTLRTQLKSVLRKTGSSSQAQLLSRIRAGI